MNGPKYLTAAEALAMAGHGKSIILEVVGTEEGTVLVRTHYINTESDRTFQSVEPFIEISYELLADKMAHVMLMVASLQAQLSMEISAPGEIYDQLQQGLYGLVRMFAAEFNVPIQSFEDTDVTAEKTALQQPMGVCRCKKEEGCGIAPEKPTLVLIRTPKDLQKFVAMLGNRTQKGDHNCGH
jgi:hypothetical protein